MEIEIQQITSTVTEGDLRVLTYRLTYPQTLEDSAFNTYYADYIRRLEISVRAQAGAYGKRLLERYLQEGGVPRRFRTPCLFLHTTVKSLPSEREGDFSFVTVTQKLEWKQQKTVFLERTESQCWDFTPKEPVLCKKERPRKRRLLGRLHLARWKKG